MRKAGGREKRLVTPRPWSRCFWVLLVGGMSLALRLEEWVDLGWEKVAMG